MKETINIDGTCIKEWFVKELNVLKKKWLYVLGYLYLLSSVFIFILGNVKLVISIPISILLLIAFKKAINNCPDVNMDIFKDKKVLIGIVLIFIVWVVISGIGGFIWQNTWDHKFRNAVFKDLVQREWPVIDGENALCYYLGFWLPSALIGKLFGLQIGYLFQVVWAFIGVMISFLMICQYLKKMKISNALIFIFYSGLDVFLFYIFSKMSFGNATAAMLDGKHIELITKYFNSSSNTTLMFWLYNQIIPFWVGMMLLLMQNNNKSIGFIFASMLLYSPFPLVALVPVIIYMIFKKYNSLKYNENMEKVDTFKDKLKGMFLKFKMACTFENFLAIPLVIIIGLFFMSNIAASKMAILPINSHTMFRYFMYILFEFIIYILLIYKNNYKNPILNILIIVTFILPFIKMGNSYDFARRTCIPLAFYIMLLIMQELEKKEIGQWKKIIITIVICLGAITPITEIIRTINMEKLVLQGKISARSDALVSVFEKEGNECYENFIATTDSIFYKYLARK